MPKRAARKGNGSAASTASCTTRKVEPNRTAAATSASEAGPSPRRAGATYGSLGPAQVWSAGAGPPSARPPRRRALRAVGRPRVGTWRLRRGPRAPGHRRRLPAWRRPPVGRRRRPARGPSWPEPHARRAALGARRAASSPGRRVILLDTTVLVYATG